MAGPWYIVVGGSEVDIDATYGTKTQGAFGFGMPPLRHNVLEQALLPGSLFQGIKVQPRVLQLQITCWARTLAAYHSMRKSLLAAVKPNVGGTLSPVEIRYSGSVAGTKVACFGYYDGGLEGQRDEGGPPPERLTVRFICYDPFWYATSATTVTLDGNRTVSNANYLVRRNSGVWANVSSAFNGYVWKLARSTTGLIYIGGNFSDVGSANGDRIVTWNPSTLALGALSTGLGTAACRAIRATADGGVYVGGDFTSIGSASGNRIVKWTGAAWSALGSGVDNGQVEAIAVGLDGTVYAGGTFTNFVDANGDYITKWNGSAWSSMGTGMNGVVYALAIGPDGTLYAGGSFATAGGVTCNGIARWDGSAWANLGSGVAVGSGEAIYELAVGPDGTLYVGGLFSAMNGVTCNNIAQWNGSTWSALGSGVNGAVYGISIDNAGLLYVSGGFSSASGLTTTDGAAIWNGTTWTHIGIDLPGALTAYAVLATPDSSDLYVGYSTSGTAYSSEQVTVNNTGSAPAYPTITIKRSGGTTARVDLLRNETTGQALYLNYSLLDGETLTITLTPGEKAVTSDFFGNVIGRALLPDSDFAEWCLQPGNNTVSLFVAESGSPTVTASCAFYAPHWSVDGVAA